MRRGIVLVDVLVGAIVLGVSLSVLVGLAGAAIASQSRGEALAKAAMMADEQLSLVLMRGPDAYESSFDTEGACDPPFDAYRYALDFDGGDPGEAYLVTVTISWRDGARERSVRVQTMIAPRLGEDPDPARQPEESVGRRQ